jgi:hypothetical protein
MKKGAASAVGVPCRYAIHLDNEFEPHASKHENMQTVAAWGGRCTISGCVDTSSWLGYPFGPFYSSYKMKVSDPFEAEQVLQSFRQGTVSKLNARKMMVGREFWMDAISEDLDFVAKGASKIRFLSAPYGGGKSHFLAGVEDMAAEKGFLVANIELHSREAPLDKFDVIFPKIMRSMKTSNGTSALDEVFSRWLDQAGLYDRQAINNEVRSVSPSLDFQGALRAYIERSGGNLAEDREITEAVFGWLSGDAISPILRNNTSIRNRITIVNASEVFGSFLTLVRRAGLAGLVVLLDEAEAVTSLAQSRRRDEANQNLRKLLDNADQNKGFMILFATTPAFIQDPQRGAQSYPALWDRIRTVVRSPKGSRPNKRSLIIELEPPGKTELVKAANIIRTLHGSAYSWDAEKTLNDSALTLYAETYLTSASVRVYRAFLRTLIGILDALEQAKGDLDPIAIIKEVRFDGEEDGGEDVP